MDVLRLICDEQNRWLDEDTARLRATRDELAAQVLPRLPPVIAHGLPELHGGELARLMKALAMMRRPRPKRRNRSGGVGARAPFQFRPRRGGPIPDAKEDDP